MPKVKIASRAVRLSAVNGNADRVVQKRRNKPGVVALREVKKYQKSTELLLPRAPFVRLVKDITNLYGDGFRFQANALTAIQEATEYYLV